MTDDIAIRHPTVDDGAALWHLIGELDGLERNTCYAYLLLCSHFAGSSLVAERNGALVGCVLGYRPPSQPDAAFVWQIGVHSDARGTGLGTRLLSEFMNLPAHRECQFLEATVGTTNQASRALFRGFARKRGVPCEEGPGYPAALFAPASHEDEDRFRIGPLRS